MTANSVLAGPTASEGVTNFVAELAKERQMTSAEFEKEFFKSMRPNSLIKRFLDPGEVAKVVVFICSPEAAAVSGAAIRADGGVIRAGM